MSEFAPKQSHETLKPVAEAREQLDAIRKELEAKAEKQPDNRKEIGEITRQVEQQALSGKEMSPFERAPQRQHPVLINKQLKDMAYSRTMLRVQKHLSLPSRYFSKAIHSKVLDKPSELVGKTVARPSSMLGGALFAAIGTSLLLWTTKRYGYEYNYLAVILLFGIGMVLGLIIELAWKSLKKSR